MTKIHSTLTSLTVLVESLELRAPNPRRGDLAAIKQSLEQNGQYRPLVVNRPTMEVLAGTTRCGRRGSSASPTSP